MNKRDNHSDDKPGMMVFGIRPVIEAIESGKEIDRLFIQRNIHNPLVSELKSLLRHHGIRPVEVPVEKLNRLTRSNHQGVVALITEVSYQRVTDVVPMLFEKGGDPIVLLLDRITDVRNFGAICRSAECFGVGAVIVPERGGAPANGDAMKASAGALSRIVVCREHNLKDTIDYLKDSGFSIIGCSEKGNKVIFESQLQGPLCIIMGSEEDGISNEYAKRCDQLVRIPMRGSVSSLNVSVAAGLALYEVVRQQSN
ncbi:MAG: 23S rRNA (guanosine(2251)-2'-O)-methyltransferase RlmB [Bacteroidota bacterium]|jgi:23S rRNA (guanosine2251-2'-O)-methyltransferase